MKVHKKNRRIALTCNQESLKDAKMLITFLNTVSLLGRGISGINLCYFFYTEGTNSSRGNVMTGDLPEDFLRISPGMNQAPAPGQMMPVQPLTYFQPTAFMQPYQQTPLGRLSITVQQVFVLLDPCG